MNENMTEKGLVEKLKSQRTLKASLEGQLKEVKEAEANTKASLIESLEARDAQATAKYEGIGYVSLAKPKLYASYKKENEDSVFKYLRDSKRGDLIKETVHHKSLGTFVKEAIESGKTLPEIISFYLQPDVRFYNV